MVPSALRGHPARLLDRLLDGLSQPSRSELTALSFLIAYWMVWTLYAVLAKSSQDIHFDMAEMIAWSQRPGWGTDKHPPLGAWTVRAWFTLFPYADWAYYLLAMAMATLALWLTWRIARIHLPPQKRGPALLLLTLVPFYNFQALKFNANTMLLPTWAFATYCFLRAFETRRLAWAALFGLSAALAMLAKYWSAFLLLGLALAALADRRRVAYLRSPSPWISLGVAALALAPHLAWLAERQFSAVRYAVEWHAAAPLDVARSLLGYLAGSAAYVAVPVALVLALARPAKAVLRDMILPSAPERRLVVTAFLFPLLLPVLVAPVMGVGLTPLWSMSAFTLLPQVLLAPPELVLARRPASWIAGLALALPLAATLAAPVVALAIQIGAPRTASLHLKLLSEKVVAEWRSRTTAPLRIVGGEADLAYGMAFYVPGRPRAFPDFAWLSASPEELAAARRAGIAIACPKINTLCLEAAARSGFHGTPIEASLARTAFGIEGRTETYVILIVPPEP